MNDVTDLTDFVLMLAIAVAVVLVVLAGRALLRFLDGPPPMHTPERPYNPGRRPSHLSYRDRLALAHEREEQEFRQAEAVRRG